MSRRVRFTAAGRLTAWYALLFAFAASSMAIGSYVLVSRAFGDGPDRASDPFARLGVPTPTPEQFRQVGEILGVDPLAIVAEASNSARNEVLREFLIRSTVALAITIVVSSLGAWWLARRGLRPVRRLTSLAQGISASNLHDRIDLVGPDDEMKALADTFDGMLARLEQAFIAQRLFAATVSHELRTPLAVLRGEADLVAGHPDASVRELKLAAAAQAGVERSNVLIASLLALSRAESGTAGRTPVDVADIVGVAVGDLADLADGAGVALELELELKNATIVGDDVLVRSLVDNLVRNAMTHNHRGGSVWVRVDAVDDTVAICVENTGRMIAAAELEVLTRPFARGSADTAGVPGSGIGTAVVQAVTTAHRGRFTLASRPAGGLVATVVLPAR
jgi:signal transduction histidine kinase